MVSKELVNVRLQDPLVIDNAIKWHRKRTDFADAIHPAKSHALEALITIDKEFIKSALKIATIPVKSP
jgi:predicted nucleic-acid-binding protein